MAHPDAHRFESDHDFQDYIHGADKPMPYFDSDPALADELAWEKLPDEMLALCLLFARHDYRCVALREFYRECGVPSFSYVWNALIDGNVNTTPIIELLASDYDDALPQPLRAVCDWFHDKLLAVWEEYYSE